VSADGHNLELVERQLREDARILWVLGLLCVGLGLLFAVKATASVQGRDDAIIYAVVVGGLVLGGGLMLWRGLRNPRRHPLMRALTGGGDGDGDGDGHAIDGVSICYRSVQGGTYEARVEVRLGPASVQIVAPEGREHELADWLRGFAVR